MRERLNSKLVAKLTPREVAYRVTDTECAGLYVEVRPSGRRTFYLSYKTAGKNTALRLGAHPEMSVEDARRDATDRKAGLRVVGVPVPATETGVLTLRGILEAYPAIARRRNQYRKQRNIERVVERVETCFAHLLDLPVHTCTPISMGAYRVTREKHVSSSTVNRDIVTLKSVLSAAAREGVIINPLAGLHVNTGKERPKWGERGAHRYLRPDEREAIFWDLGQRRTRIKPMVITCMYAGLRTGEIDTLERRDVDLESGVITVRAENAKSGKERHIPIHVGVLLPVLTEWVSGRKWRATDKLFPGGNWRSAFEQLCKRCGIKDLRRHDLRHDFGSMLAMAGADAFTIKELMGHESVNTSARYVKLAMPAQRAAVERL